MSEKRDQKRNAESDFVDNEIIKFKHEIISQKSTRFVIKHFYNRLVILEIILTTLYI